MPRTCIDTADAIKLAETLQLIAHWLTADPATLSPSFLAYIGHLAYGLDAHRADLDRFTFLLGGNDGKFLLGQDPPNLSPPGRGQNSHRHTSTNLQKQNPDPCEGSRINRISWSPRLVF